jgi:carbamoyltransferase
MAEEERLSGVKHTREYPVATVEWLLHEAGLTAADIGTVAYNFAGHRYLAGLAGTPGHLLRPATRRRALPRAASLAVIHHRYRQRMSILRGLFPNARVRAVPHHAAHRLYAFAASGFTDAAVLIIDSLGENCTTSIGSGQVLPYRAGHGPPCPPGPGGSPAASAPWTASPRRSGCRSPPCSGARTR